MIMQWDVYTLTCFEDCSLLLFLYFICLICLYFSLFPHVYVFVSLFTCCLFFICYIRVSFQLFLSFAMNMHMNDHALMHRDCDAMR